MLAQPLFSVHNFIQQLTTVMSLQLRIVFTIRQRDGECVPLSTDLIISFRALQYKSITVGRLMLALYIVKWGWNSRLTVLGNNAAKVLYKDSYAEMVKLHEVHT